MSKYPKTCFILGTAMGDTFGRQAPKTGQTPPKPPKSHQAAGPCRRIEDPRT